MGLLMISMLCVTFKETEDDLYPFSVAVQADIVVKGKTRRDYEEDMTRRMVCRIFHGHSMGGTYYGYHYHGGDYTKECFSKEDALTQILQPMYMPNDLNFPCREVFKEILSTCVELQCLFRLKFSKPCVLLYILLLSQGCLDFLDEPISIC